MPDITRLEDDDTARKKHLNLQQTPLAHAWEWWKYHAEPRIALMRFYIITLGGVAVGVGWLYQQHEYSLCGILSLFGALLSYGFLRLDLRTSDLVKIAEKALCSEQALMAETAANHAMRLCVIAEEAKANRHYPRSYRDIVMLVLGAAAALFISIGVVSLVSTARVVLCTV